MAFFLQRPQLGSDFVAPPFPHVLHVLQAMRSGLCRNSTLGLSRMDYLFDFPGYSSVRVEPC
jgi:hypothetical protein